MKSDPDFEFEKLYPGQCVAGVDEAGRGPLAGPVVAAAVVLDPDHVPDGLNDSKQLTHNTRLVLFDQIAEHADYGVGLASVEEIDAINILQASHLAMCRAVQQLNNRPDHVLIDGRMVPKALNLPATGIVKGDARSLSIAAASIVAKITRDQMMVDLAQQHPGYGWETNKGYPSKSHKQALLDLGVTPHHRRTFRPVHNILYQDKILSD